MRRGEIWWAERELVTVAPVTTRIHRIPTEVPLGPAEGQTLTAAIGPLPAEKLAAVERSLMFALGLVSRPR